MKRLLRTAFTAASFCFTIQAFSQLMTINGGVFHATTGSLMISNGGVQIQNTANFVNDGDLTVTKNSTFSQNGNFILNSSSNVSGNGTYKIEQDWINDAIFSGDNSTVVLFGDTRQFITTTNGTNTTFNTLTLTGNGTGIDRKKSLVSCNLFVSPSGFLNINDRELETQTNSATVFNNSINSVTNNQNFGAEGFVSSIQPGYFLRNTNSASNYLFPVGSSDGTQRYRPVVLTPNSSSTNEYAVRLNNYDPNTDGFDRNTNDGTITAANSLFYHSVAQTQGTENADISIFYVNSADGDWSSIANWKNSWNNMLGSMPGGSGNFSTVTKNAWNISSNEYPYVLVNIQDQFSIPNIFTPNNDGVNDQFLVNAKNISEFNLTIVNRWGEVVFETNNINHSWDGKFKNEMCKEGTYFYVAHGKSSNSQDYKAQGFLQLEY